MKFKDYKKTLEYKAADVLEIFSEETGLEFDDDFPEEELDEMEVVNTSGGGWLSITLKKEGFNYDGSKC